MRTFAPLTHADLPVPADRLGTPSREWQRRTVLGYQVDVVPFGEIETNGTVRVREHTISVLGCAEAAQRADLVTLPSGAQLPFAPLEILAVLKLTAFRDRHPASTKDLGDLALILRAASHGGYGEEVWDDLEALAALDHDHELAGAFRLGRRARACFTDRRAALLDEVLDTATPRLEAAWPRTVERRILNAWLRGIRAA